MEQFVCKQMRQEIGIIETGMEEVVQMHGWQLRARTGQAKTKSEEEVQQLARKWHAWMVRMHKINEERSRKGARRRGRQNL